MTAEKTPSYSLPPDFIAGVVLHLLAGRPRSFRRDAIRLLSRRGSSVQITGLPRVCAAEKYIVTVNHYTRPGFPAWWIALVLSAFLEQDVHWIMTDSWKMEGRWYGGLVRKITRSLFARLAKMYGFSTTPPMPLSPDDSAGRGDSVRRIFSHVRQHSPAVVGYVPEGRDFADSRLGWPPYAAGRFVYHIKRLGYHILPVGLYEEERQLCVHIGQPYNLGEPHSHATGDIHPVTYRLLTRRQTDLLLTRTVMRRIAVLLPENLRGEFGDDIQAGDCV